MGVSNLPAITSKEKLKIKGAKWGTQNFFYKASIHK
jgi:hypothetical protein